MPWKGVTVSEQRENFLRDYHLRYYSVSELAERFSVSRKTAYKWIDRYEQHGKDGLSDQSRRSHSCPWQTEPYWHRRGESHQVIDSLLEGGQSVETGSRVARVAEQGSAGLRGKA